MLHCILLCQRAANARDCEAILARGDADLSHAGLPTVDRLTDAARNCDMPPTTRYARSGEISVAYQVVGNGPRDLVLAPGFVSHLEWAWEEPTLARFLERLASFSRLILFDKRGTGLSDPTDTAPTYEERMDDLRAVMDDVGSERAAILGVSEGGAMAALFAAAYPKRANALILYGAYARLPAAPDYPEGFPRDRLEAYLLGLIDGWGKPEQLRLWAPSRADDARLAKWFAALQRLGASPGMARKLVLSYPDIDVRSVLNVIQVPTLVLHRAGDPQVRVALGRYLGNHIKNARYVEFEGNDHLFFIGNTDVILDEIEEFLTGVRRGPEPDRALATVMFIDIVGSTEIAASVGDRRWAEILTSYTELVARLASRYRGRIVKMIGDGVLVTFDGPARAIRCAAAVRNAVRDLGVEVRAGLHTGEIELLGDDVGGIAVHIAARVMSEANAGQIMTSSTVKDLVAGSDIAFFDCGLHTLKGVPETWHLFQAGA
jgi:class 3 adenylate cyclase/alpha-beta hydrolase superfamily lysophospholipase